MGFISGVVHRSALQLSKSAIQRRLASGELTRICRGWYAWAGADEDAIQARRVGGTLTGPTLLAKYGVWLLRDARLHVRVNPNTPRIGGRACVHYLPPAVSERDELINALVAMAYCSSREALVVAIDSLIDTGLLRMEEIAPIANRHYRLRTAITLARPGSQAGGETLVRLFLASSRIKHRTQVQLEGGGRHDLVVGDRLVIEVDGREHHLGEQFETDRRRDRELLRRGYLVFRISYRMLYQDWEQTKSAILEMVRRDDHLWPRARRPNVG